LTVLEVPMNSAGLLQIIKKRRSVRVYNGGHGVGLSILDNLDGTKGRRRVRLSILQEIVEDLEAALEQFREIATDLGAEISKETE